jgi:transcriptional regulator with XRE-family HTH domain
MKKNRIIKVPLLITQEEIAILLGITRSQWAMYESGQRGLSSKSKYKLEIVLLNANKVASVKREKLGHEVKQENEAQKVVTKMLHENILQQLGFQRKLEQMKKKYQAALNTLHFVSSFQEGTANESVLKVLKIKANKVLDKNGLHFQEAYKIKLEVLKHEEIVLLKRKKAIVT